MNSDNYESIYPVNSNAIQECITKDYFSASNNPLINQKGLCTSVMSRKCASDWDDSCRTYSKIERNPDEFFKQALISQFCNLSNKKTCYNVCQKSNPLSSDSELTCQTNGDQVYRDDYTQFNIDTQFNSLSIPSPIKIAPCPKVCDSITDNNVSENNNILNECLDRGIAFDVLINIAQNAISSNIKVTNRRFKKFIKKFVIMPGNSLIPGYSSLGASPMLTTLNINTPAVDAKIKKNNKYNMMSTVGPQMNQKVEKFRYQEVNDGPRFVRA